MQRDEPVPSGCEAIDELLEGGYERGTITQVYGGPGSGKTNLAIAAAVATAANEESVVFIDTEGLSADRLHQLAAGTTAHDPATVIDRISISSAIDFEEQTAAVKEVSEFAPDIGLVILDSATGFYRLKRADETPDEAGAALRTVANQIVHLLGLARRHDFAVLFTNQVFTDPEQESMRPLGGHTLQHWSGVVLALERFRGGNRRITLEKHRSQPAGESVRFRITEDRLVASDLH